MAKPPGDDSAPAGQHQAEPQNREIIAATYRHALAGRIAQQPESLRTRLAARRSKHEFALASAPAATALNQAAATANPLTDPLTHPLAELLAYIGQQTHAPLGDLPFPPPQQPTPRATQTGETATAQPATQPAPELKAVSIFRDAWSKLSTEQQLTQTLAQAPENAGPMNSQHLVLRSLQLMRDVAPDYLQGFMSHIDTLIWLEQADPARTPGRSSAGNSEKKPRVAKRGAAKR